MYISRASPPVIPGPGSFSDGPLSMERSPGPSRAASATWHITSHLALVFQSCAQDCDIHGSRTLSLHPSGPCVCLDHTGRGDLCFSVPASCPYRAKFAQITNKQTHRSMSHQRKWKLVRGGFGDLAGLCLQCLVGSLNTSVPHCPSEQPDS